jgi:CheY-like chemotaxis protein
MPTHFAPRRVLKILLVDDHPGCRVVTARFLGILGHEVVDAGDAAAAESLFLQPGGFHLVVLDLHLHDVDGLVLAQRLAAQSPDLRVLFISGQEMESAGDQASLQAPQRGFLSKPFGLEALRAKVDALLADLL